MLHLLATFAASVGRLGAWGPLLFIGGFAVASAAFVPAGLLTMAAGVLYGQRAGTVFAFLGALLGACLAFMVSRYIARARVERWLGSYPRAELVRGAVGADGRRIVALLRLSPVIPFNMINVAMGVTSIRFVDFVIASAAMLPVTALYVYFGTVAGTLLEIGRHHAHRGTAYYALQVLGLAATVAATIIVARAATAALGRDPRAHE